MDWDLSTVVPQDYIQSILSSETDLANIRSHVHILLSLAICGMISYLYHKTSIIFSDLELNTLAISPSILCCACIKAAMKGLGMVNISSIDEFIFQNIHCNKVELSRIQRMIEQFLQTCLQDLPPRKRRRCLAPIDTINKPTGSPRVK